MLELNFSEDNTDGPTYVVVIGQDPELGVTEEGGWGDHRLRYEVIDRVEWEMTMVFTDI